MCTKNKNKEKEDHKLIYSIEIIPLKKQWRPKSELTSRGTGRNTRSNPSGRILKISAMRSTYGKLNII